MGKSSPFVSIETCAIMVIRPLSQSIQMRQRMKHQCCESAAEKQVPDRGLDFQVTFVSLFGRWVIQKSEHFEIQHKKTVNNNKKGEIISDNCTVLNSLKFGWEFSEMKLQGYDSADFQAEIEDFDLKKGYLQPFFQDLNSQKLFCSIFSVK